MRVYIAGPYTKGDVVLNVREAIRMADLLVEMGYIPFVPHLTHLWHMASPHEPKFWYEYDYQWLDMCNAVIRIPGDSVGADAEVERAKKNHIPVFYSLHDFLQTMGTGTWRYK